MTGQIIIGLIIPFAGTAFGAALVFFLKKQFSAVSIMAMSGLAAGVMIAASLWSLIIPSIEQCAGMGMFSFVPAAVGVWCGALFLMLIDKAVTNSQKNSTLKKGSKSPSPASMMMFAVTLHNIPEGMAVGIMLAGLAFGNGGVTAGAALAFAVGIGIQNIPEGAIISMPVRAKGRSRLSSFFCGVLSGAVEPLGALITFFAAAVFIPAMPYLLSFAAGAMFYVVIVELVPEFSENKGSFWGMIFFVLGFTLMMALDVALG